MGETQYQFLVVSDTNNVVDYLFSTSKYKLIRGASTLLDYLNREETPRIAIEQKGVVLSVGGGEARVLFQKSENAEKYISNLRERYLDVTDEVTLTMCNVKRENNEPISQWLQRAETMLRLKEIESDKKQMLSIELSPIIKRCELCFKRPGDKTDENGEDKVFWFPDGKKLLCTSCYSKISKVHEVSVQIKKLVSASSDQDVSLSGLMDIHKALLEKERRSSWVNKLGQLFSQENEDDRGKAGLKYMGFIYSDGKGIGGLFRDKLLAQFKDDDDSKFIEEFQNFSKKLHLATINAAVQTAEEFTDCAVDYAMVGGDDFVAILPGKYAVNYAYQFVRNFEDQTYQLLGQKVFLGVGVVIAHIGYPINRLFQLSYDLMSNAKSKEKQGSVLDFMVITDSTVQSVDQIRASENYGLKNRSVRMNGYRIDSDHPDSYSKLEEVIYQLKKHGFPRSKMKEIYDIAKEPDETMMKYRWSIWRARIGTKIKNVLDQWMVEFKNTPFPFGNDNQQKYTPLLDLFDLYDFVDRRGEDNASEVKN